MHIAARNRQRAHRNPAAAGLHRGRIRPAERQHLALGFHTRLRTRRQQRFPQIRIRNAPAIHHLHGNALAELNVRLLRAGGVAPRGHVNGDPLVRRFRERRHLRAAAADFLLHGENGNDGLLRRADGLQEANQQRARRAVVHCGACDAVRAQLEAVVRVHAHVANLHHRLGVRLVLCADVHKQVLHRRVLAHFGHHNTLHAIRERHMPRQAHGRADTADVRHAQEALFLNARDDVADMIHVRGQHDFLRIRLRAVLHANQIAQRIRLDAVHIRRNLFPDDRRYRFFQSRRRDRFEHLLQQFQHNSSPLLIGEAPEALPLDSGRGVAPAPHKGLRPLTHFRD